MFAGGHAATDITEYNRLLTLDIDKLDSGKLEQVKQSLTNDEFVFAFWLSPSGKGYKGLVLLDYGDIEYKDIVYWHRVAFNQLFAYFCNRNREMQQKWSPECNINSNSSTAKSVTRVQQKR